MKKIRFALISVCISLILISFYFVRSKAVRRVVVDEIMISTAPFVTTSEGHLTFINTEKKQSSKKGIEVTKLDNTSNILPVEVEQNDSNQIQDYKIALFGDSYKENNHFIISHGLSKRYWYENSLLISLDEVIYGYLKLTYKTNTHDDLKYFDTTKLVLKLNDSIYFVEESIIRDWKDIYIPLDIFMGEALTISLFSGNLGDGLYPSWVQIKDIDFLQSVPVSTLVETKIDEKKVIELGIVDNK